MVATTHKKLLNKKLSSKVEIQKFLEQSFKDPLEDPRYLLSLMTIDTQIMVYILI